MRRWWISVGTNNRLVMLYLEVNIITETHGLYALGVLMGRFVFGIAFACAWRDAELLDEELAKRHCKEVVLAMPRVVMVIDAA